MFPLQLLGVVTMLHCVYVHQSFQQINWKVVNKTCSVLTTYVLYSEKLLEASHWRTNIIRSVT